MIDQDRSALGAKREMRRYDQAVVFAIALVAPVVAFGIFLIVFQHLDARIGTRLTALPEVHSLIGSVDVSAQKTAYLVAVAFLAMVWTGLFFTNGSSALWQTPRDAVPISPRGALSRRLLLLFDIILVAIFILWAAYVAISVQWANVYGPDDVPWLMAGDPHAYSVFGRSCEVLLGTVESNNDREAYGAGGALLYCGLRALGFPPDYASMLLIVRLANFAMAATFVWALWRYWGNLAIGSIWARVIALLAFLVVVRRLLEQDGVLVLFANLGGLRYAPVLLLLAAACCTSWSDRLLIRALRLMTAGVCIALFPDTGTLAAIGLAVMEGAQGRDRIDVLRRGALAVAATMGFAIVAAFVLAWLIPSAGFAFGWAVHFANSGFGGNFVTWDRTSIVIIAIAVVVATLCVARAGQVARNSRACTSAALSKQDAVALAVSMMMIAWTMYFFHRPPGPSYVHIIFTLMVMFPLSWITQQMRLITNAGKYILGPSLLLVCLFLVQQARILPEIDDIRSPRKASLQDLVDWSGLRLPGPFAAMMTERLDELRHVRKTDAFVVTGTPFAVAASGGEMRAPVEALFTLGRETAVSAFLQRIQAEHPSMIIFDGEGSPAWGADAILRIAQRIETGIQPTYVRSEGVKHWRVWTALEPKASR